MTDFISTLPSVLSNVFWSLLLSETILRIFFKTSIHDMILMIPVILKAIGNAMLSNIELPKKYRERAENKVSFFSVIILHLQALAVFALAIVCGLEYVVSEKSVGYSLAMFFSTALLIYSAMVFFSAAERERLKFH